MSRSPRHRKHKPQPCATSSPRPLFMIYPPWPIPCEQSSTGPLRKTPRLLRAVLANDAAGTETPVDTHPDLELSKGWRNGEYPYKNLLSRKSYEKQKYQLQVELLKLQAWVKATGQKVVILFEGRDAAGKGGTIKRFMEHLNPRGARVVVPGKAERGRTRAMVLSARCRAPANRR